MLRRGRSVWGVIRWCGMMDEFKEIARRSLNRDRPFDGKLEADFHAELNAKLQPRPAPDQGDEVVWDGGC